MHQAMHQNVAPGPSSAQGDVPALSNRLTLTSHAVYADATSGIYVGPMDEEP
jgi:hypothetical protein